MAPAVQFHFSIHLNRELKEENGFSLCQGFIHIHLTQPLPPLHGAPGRVLRAGCGSVSCSLSRELGSGFPKSRRGTLWPKHSVEHVLQWPSVTAETSSFVLPVVLMSRCHPTPYSLFPADCFHHPPIKPGQPVSTAHVPGSRFENHISCSCCNTRWAVAKCLFPHVLSAWNYSRTP